MTPFTAEDRYLIKRFGWKGVEMLGNDTKISVKKMEEKHVERSFQKT